MSGPRHVLPGLHPVFQTDRKYQKVATLNPFQPSVSAVGRLGKKPELPERSLSTFLCSEVCDTTDPPQRASFSCSEELFSSHSFRLAII